MSFAATQMDLEIIIHSEVSQRQKQISMVSLRWGVQKDDANEFIYKTNRLTDIENKFMVTKGERGEG